MFDPADRSEIRKNRLKNVARAGATLGICVIFSTLAFATEGPSAQKAVQQAVRQADPYRGLWDQEHHLLFARPELTWGRDPFLKQPGFALNEFDEPKWELVAVFFDDETSEAIINGKRVRAGDEIQGRVVEEIGQNYVLLSRDDSVLELNLPTSSQGPGSIRIEEIDPGDKK
ncbi:MAG: hypothetical protein KGQ59_00870 [Bdellovibrionales bacterium]|nr:hypothetical protein [Bdellovibrionales bacterium]